MKAQHTLFHWILEWIAFLLLIATVVGFLVCLPDLPEQVPIHFGDDGQPDDWGSASELWILLGVEIVIYAGTTVIDFFPGTWNLGVGRRRSAFRTVNLPTGTIPPALRPRIYRMTLTLLLVTKIGILLVLGGLLFWGSIGGNALPLWAEPAALALLLGPVAVYLIRVAVLKK